MSCEKSAKPCCGDRRAADCPVLPELVKATAQQFTVKEVSADKAYLSQQNVETIASVCAEAAEEE